MNVRQQIRRAGLVLALLSVLVPSAAPLAKAAILCEPAAAESPLSCHEPPPACTAGGDGGASCCAVMTCATSTAPREELAYPPSTLELVTTLQESAADDVLVAGVAAVRQLTHAPPARERLSLISILLI